MELEDRVKSYVDSYRVSIGENIKNTRKEKGYTQSQLAHQTDLSINYVGYIERGKQFLSLKTFLEVAYALRIDPEKLLSKRIYLPSANKKRASSNKLTIKLEDYIKVYEANLRRNIRAARKEGGYAQYELADKIAKSTNYVVCIETGRRLPSFKTFLTISYALRIEPEKLLSKRVYEPSKKQR